MSPPQPQTGLTRRLSASTAALQLAAAAAAAEQGGVDGEPGGTLDTMTMNNQQDNNNTNASPTTSRSKLRRTLTPKTGSLATMAPEVYMGTPYGYDGAGRSVHKLILLQ